MLKTAAPQVVTLGGVLAALLAIVWAPSRPYWACNAIIASCLCDMVDGRIARALGVQSQFGAELDSLADVIAFGVAPAMLAYHTALGNGSKYLVSPWLLRVSCFWLAVRYDWHVSTRGWIQGKTQTNSRGFPRRFQPYL